MDKCKIVLLYNTIRYLRLKQIFYRIYYIIRKPRLPERIDRKLKNDSRRLNFRFGIKNLKSYDNGVFTFLNIAHKFNKIDWNFSEHGKLWLYNLNYFDFLNQDSISNDEGLSLIKDYIENQSKIKVGLEAYLTSLRIINWIKFISFHQICDKKIDSTLFKHLLLLNKNLEFHLLGNHLLENAYALFLGAFYFDDQKILKKAERLLQTQLDEQILSDGAHFELSPMYHQVLLLRLLDCINFLKNNKNKNDSLLNYLIAKSAIMLSWLKKVTYKSGDIPKVNDSTFDIVVSSKDIFDYAKELDVKIQNFDLSDSYYRKWVINKFEIFMDIGRIGPNYIPGHGHADTFNFELFYDEKPIIVDLGISTYDKNSTRLLERSTESHNTVTIDGENSSEIWDSFRVARRAKIIYLKEQQNKIIATHDGYKRIGANHTRTFIKFDNFFVVEDHIKSNKNHKIESFLHFHPNCEVILKGKYIHVNSVILIKIFNTKSIKVEDYNYSLGFNKTKKAKKVRALVENKSKIEIRI